MERAEITARMEITKINQLRERIDFWAKSRKCKEHRINWTSDWSKIKLIEQQKWVQGIMKKNKERDRQ